MTTNLPEYFAVKDKDSANYLVYHSAIYKADATLNISVSVVWPMEGISLPLMTQYPIEQDYQYTFIRKWNGRTYRSCEWCQSGFELNMKIPSKEGLYIIPVLLIESSGLDILPFNSYGVVPQQIQTTLTRRRGKDRVPKFCTEDPVHSEARVEPPPDKSPSKSTLELPSHVQNIILRDSISKNEDCPISSEPITQENGFVTYCGHVFTKQAIQRWLLQPSSNNCCPICKQRCQ
jgi:hypothetical protein